MSEGTRSSYAELLKQAAIEIKALRSKLDGVERAKAEPIAVIGVGCRFPGGAVDAASFWRLLHDGVDAIREVPPDRWNIDEYYDPHPGVPGKMSTRWGGFIDDVDKFDPYFFGISPRECIAMDPQQRLFLEVAWEALEDAGQAIDRLRGSPTGVYVGVFGNDYAILQQANPTRIDVYGSSAAGCAIPGRLSFLLDLRGPSVAVDTACSSSLTAIHLACESLRNCDISLAVVGGVNLMLSPIPTISLSQNQALAPDGRSKAFDARANGMSRGEGCGVVILKRLSEALAAGDPIHALIRSSAVNQDGSSTSFTSPNVLAQQALIRKAVDAAGIDPGDVSYVEAHGTGTALGDPIEIEALKAVYGKPRSDGRPCTIGALKTNMGHLEGAAGVAGLIKVVLSLEHEAIPQNLHFTQLNPHISLEGTAVVIPTVRRAWPRGTGRRLGAVSAFGLNGSNAHVILEEAPQPAAIQEIAMEKANPGSYLLPLSARSPGALKDLARAYTTLLSVESAISLDDLGHTVSLRRTHHDHRLAVVGRDRKDLGEHLAAFVRGESRPGVAAGTVERGRRRGVVFVFSPHGSQWIGMGRELIQTAPAFRASLETCAALIHREVGWSVLEKLASEDARWLEQIDILQPTLFALQVSLAALFKSLGIEPDAVVGHSMGEVAAAHVAGAIDLEDAVRITCRRSRLLRTITGRGAMGVVELSLDAARAAIAGFEDKLAIAVSNSPRSTVVSGDPEALEELFDKLEREGVFCGWGVADVASHSPQMKQVCAALVRELGGIRPHAESVPFYSPVTGALEKGQELGPSYWVRNLEQTVFFSLAVQRLLADGFDTFLEMSPHPILAPAIQDWLRHGHRDGVVLPAMRRDAHSWTVVLEALGAFYAAGVPVEWKRLYPSGTCVKLPAYPWQRERFWLDTSNPPAPKRGAPAPALPSDSRAHPLLDQRWEASFPEATHYWQIDLTVESFPYLVDHAIQGSIVVPAVLFLEMVAAGARELLGNADFALEHVEFKKMLVLPGEGSATLQLVLTNVSAQEARFRVHSRLSGGAGRGHPWTLHVLGDIQMDPGQTPTLVDRLPIQNRCADVLTAATLYQGAIARGVEFGPMFKGIIELRRGNREMLARIRLPEHAASESAGYAAHPALLDACFQTLGGLGILDRGAAKADAIYLPTGLESFRLRGSAGTSISSHATLRSSGQSGTAGRDKFEGDFVAFDDEGHAVIEVRGAHFQQFDGGQLGAFDAWLHAVAWIDKPLRSAVNSPQVEPGNWLVFADAHGVARDVRACLSAHGQHAVVAVPGTAYRMLEPDLYAVDPTQPGDFRRLLHDVTTASGPPLRGVIFLWPLDGKSPPDLTQASLQAALDLGCAGVMHLVQALIQAGFRDMPRLWLVTQGAQAVGDAPRPVAIAQAPIWAIGRTINYEHPELACMRIDLDPEALANESATSLWEQILRSDGEDQVALRRGARYVARLRRSRFVDNDGDPELHANATYLVTGGLSGLGLEVAAWMVEKGARHVVLIGRRGMIPAAQPMIDRMTQAGAQVVVERADVTRHDDLQDIFAKIDKDMPPLRGVVHSAVTLDDGILLRQTHERFRAAVAAKLEGALLLHQLTEHRPLDFFVLFSSASSLLGGAGDASYGASNTFVDALAHHRRSLGLAALSINWGPWTEVGLGTQENRGDRFGSRGIPGMTPRQGLSIFGRLLGQPVAQMGVMKLDMRQWRQFYPKVAAAPFFSELAREENASRQTTAQAQNFLAGLRSATRDERRERLENLVREQIGEVLRLDPSRITADTALHSLGFDSLMAVELRNRLELLLDATLPVTMVWGYPTITALVPHLATKIGIPLDPPVVPAPETSPKDGNVLDLLLGDIEHLSTESALRMLAGKDGKES